MDKLLDRLSVYSYKLHRLNMRQVAGDYDYLIAWLKSVDTKDPSKHFGVSPAGENTIAPLANNCPIPYIATDSLIKDCLDKDLACELTGLIREVLQELKSICVSNEETTAIDCYIDYTNKLYVWLGGSIEPPVQEIRGYLRSAAYQTSNMNLSANSTNHLYGQGESGFLAAEAGKTYTLTGAYRNNDASVDISGCSLSIVNNTVKLVWGSTSAQVCYITIDVA